MSLYTLAAELCEYRRDLISDGYDQALEHLLRQVPLEYRNIRAVRTGTPVWDWVVPKKWRLNAGWIEHRGRRILDAAEHPFHVASYSLPVDRDIDHRELQQHLSTSTRHPEKIPWEFLYYEPDWRFCTSAYQFRTFDSGEYHVHIDSSFADGYLKVGDVLIPGAEETEVWLVAHLCHPHMANDNASGCAVLAEVAKWLAARSNRYTYRILFTPETIGTIAYLATQEQLLWKHVIGGVVVDMVGHDEPLKLQSGYTHCQLDDVFAPLVASTHGYRDLLSNDDKVLNAPGVRIPTVTLTRARGWQHPDGIADYYHTSGDEPALLDETAMQITAQVLWKGLMDLEDNIRPTQTTIGPICLSRHKLWVDWRDNPALNMAQQRTLDMLDGRSSAAQIAATVGVSMGEVCAWLDELRKGGLVSE